MSDLNFRAENHYVSRGYLKQWSGSGAVWTYRTLVANASEPLWRKKSPRAVAYIRDLYTTIQDGEATDATERWFDETFEAPAAQAIQRAVTNQRLSVKDWHLLIHFLAAQDLRTPISYFQETERWDKTMENLLQSTLHESICKIKELQDTGQPIPKVPKMQEAEMPLRVFRDTEAGEIGVEILNGRQFWIYQMRRTLENTAAVLLKHRWTILAPTAGTDWNTSDNPVLHLRVSGRTYRIERGWAVPNMVIAMPLSPQHLLFTQVGCRAPQRGSTMSALHEALIRRATAENAFRYVFANHEDPLIPSLRSREVSLDKYQQELAYWTKWHEQQSAAEAEFERSRRDTEWR